MAIPSRFTKVKIAAGYTLLLVVLLLSLLFVHREMEKLSDTDDVQSLQTDSLLLLLKEKDENTIRMLQIINEANESMITPVELDSIIAEQDTVITQHRAPSAQKPRVPLHLKFQPLGGYLQFHYR